MHWFFFAEGGKPENPEKNYRSREENQHEMGPVMASGPGIEPGPDLWEASALTTAPSLLPAVQEKVISWNQSILNQQHVGHLRYFPIIITYNYACVWWPIIIIEKLTGNACFI